MKPPPDPASIAGARVLVLETELVHARLLKAVFGVCGCVVVCVHDVPSALTAAEVFRPEAVIVAVDSRALPGLDLGRVLRAHAAFQAAVFVALSSNPVNFAPSFTTATGYDALVTLPIDTRALPRTIGKLLTRRQGGS